MTAAVVLNYRTAERTIAAVQALQQSALPPDPVIVVDNASGDGSVETLRTALDRVEIISAEKNAGFSAGCNLGIRAALGRGAARVLLLNSDVIVSADMIQQLIAAMEIDPSCGIAGPVLLSTSHPHRIESTGIRYWPASGRILHQDFNKPAGDIPTFASKPVDGVSGCAMLISQQVFDRVGDLAEDFFFGFEDLDFCLRAKAAGFSTVCVGGTSARHEGHASIGPQSPARVYFAARNQLLLANRTHARSDFASAARAWSVIGLNFAHAIRQSDVPRIQALRAVARGVVDHFKGRYGPAPSDL
jgi:GT2 family glycosyltransferase